MRTVSVVFVFVVLLSAAVAVSADDNTTSTTTTPIPPTSTETTPTTTTTPTTPTPEVVVQGYSGGSLFVAVLFGMVLMFGLSQLYNYWLRRRQEDPNYRSY